MSEHVRPFDPPRPVWVRQPAGRHEPEDMAVPGVQLAWVRLEEWGKPVWVARVLVSGETRLVPATSIRLRDVE